MPIRTTSQGQPIMQAHLEKLRNDVPPIIGLFAPIIGFFIEEMCPHYWLIRPLNWLIHEIQEFCPIIGLFVLLPAPLFFA